MSNATFLQRLPDAWVDRLFARLHAMYGARWLDLWTHIPLPAVKAVWAEGLAGYSSDQIRAGLAAASAKGYPPSLPEFQGWCRAQAQLGPEEAFTRAVGAFYTGRWPNRIIYWTAIRLGRHTCLGATWQSIQTRWTEGLLAAEAEDRAGRLPDIPPPRAALPAPGSETVTQEQAAANIARLKAMLARCQGIEITGGRS